MSGKVGRKECLASGFAAICAVTSPSHAATSHAEGVELDKRVELVRELLRTPNSTAESLKVDSWRLVAQFNNVSDEWADWNNCGTDENPCENSGD